MRLLHFTNPLVWLGFSLLVVVPGTASQTSPAAADALAKVPPCALKCLVTAIQASPCALTNQTCLCTNSQLQESSTRCILGACTVKESLTAKNITQTTCNAPIRNKSKEYIRLSNSLASLTGGVLVLRLFSKYFTKSAFGNDDIFIVLTFAAGIPSSIITVHGTTANGLGRDVWTVSFSQITAFLLNFYIMEVLYFLQVALLKLSLLFFYLRIFPGPKIRRLIWGTIIFDALFGLVFVFVGIFQCRPISYYWNVWDGEHKGTCISVNALGWSNAVISVLLDFWMLGLPMSQVVSLQLHWKKKVGVGMMFVVGTFVTVVSIIRLQSIVHFAKSVNPTWDNLLVSQWSTVEINIGIICACMPTLRVLLVRLFPRLKGTTVESKGSGYINQSGSRLGVPVQNKIAGVAGKAENGKSSTGIGYSQSYAVQYGHQWDNDETHLVPLSNMEPGKSKSEVHAIRV